MDPFFAVYRNVEKEKLQPSGGEITTMFASMNGPYLLDKDIANLVQDADPMRRIFSTIKDNLSPYLNKTLTPLSIIEDQAPNVKKAQRNLSNREALMAKKYSNKQEARELVQLIDNLKNSSSKID